MTDDTSAVSRSSWRWIIAAAVVALLVYPLARLILDKVRGGEPAVVATPAAESTPIEDADQVKAATVLVNQSLEDYRAGRFRECLDTAKESARLNPRLATAFNNAGICAGVLRLWDEAIRNTEEAIRLDPTFQLARNNLAWVRQEQKAEAAKR